MFSLAHELDLPLVATNDVHYARREQSDFHDVLLCIQTGKTVNEPKRMRMENDSFYIRSAEEMAALFPEAPESLTNTVRIAEMCEVEIEFGNYHLPVFAVPEGYDAQSYLRQLCEEGLEWRYPVITDRQVNGQCRVTLQVVGNQVRIGKSARMGPDHWLLRRDLVEDVDDRRIGMQQ